MTDASATDDAASESVADLGCFDGRGTSQPYRACPYAVARNTHFLMVPIIAAFRAQHLRGDLPGVGLHGYLDKPRACDTTFPINLIAHWQIQAAL